MRFPAQSSRYCGRCGAIPARHADWQSDVRPRRGYDRSRQHADPAQALVDIDSNLAIVPQLALSWKPLDPTTWEFELRSDVTFHDGTLFTAADVVFTIERARAEGSDLPAFVDGIATVEALDDHTVRFTTTEPDPSLWLKLPRLP